MIKSGARLSRWPDPLCECAVSTIGIVDVLSGPTGEVASEGGVHMYKS